jgi:hypothetical protein
MKKIPETVQAAENRIQQIKKLRAEIDKIGQDPAYCYITSDQEIRDLLNKIKLRETEEEKEILALKITGDTK